MLNVVCGVARVPMTGVIKGVVPFMVAQIAVLVLLVIFPQIVLWPLAMMSR
ncbi:TRAP transporter large permease subunit [Agrobacterium tumefaciens]|nr:TRAP transporter large permease subunit [Agrobacterium tumefaciens]